MASKHHASSIVKYLGPSAELPVADLPTLRDVLKQCQLLRERRVGPNSKYELPNMASNVLPLILSVWNRANANLVKLPIRVTDKSLTNRIQAKWTLLSKIAAKKGKVTPKERQTFESSLDKLFNILVCSCSFVNCVEAKCQDENCPSVHLNCSCPRESKIPKLDLAFMKDQQEKTGTKGRFQMAQGDSAETARQLKATKRKEIEEKATAEKEAKRKKEQEELQERMEEELHDRLAEEMMENEKANLNEEDMTEIHVDPTFHNERVERQIRSDTHSQNRTRLPKTAQSALRYDVSSRAAAAIATSTLIDYGIITADNTSQIVSTTKIKKEIERCMEEMEKLRLKVEKSITCILHDG